MPPDMPPWHVVGRRTSGARKHFTGGVTPETGKPSNMALLRRGPPEYFCTLYNHTSRKADLPTNDDSEVLGLDCKYLGDTDLFTWEKMSTSSSYLFPACRQRFLSASIPHLGGSLSCRLTWCPQCGLRL